MNEMAAIQDRTIPMGFQTKFLGPIKLEHKEFKYFSNLLQLGKDASNLVGDFKIYAKHLLNLK